MASFNSHRWRAAGIAGVISSAFAVAFAAGPVPTLLLLNGLYLGGSDIDYATGVAADSAGNAYIVGYTTSSDFPTRNSAFQLDVSRQRSAAFLTKYSLQRAVVYSTYVDGVVLGVAVDASQSPILVGYGATGGFVRRVQPDGSGFAYSIAFPNTQVSAVAVDPSGNAIVAGSTTAVDLPTVRAAQPMPGGGGLDAFAMKIDPGGRILWSTYIGGSRYDVAAAVASDAAGNAYITGRTQSVDFPTSSSAFRRVLAGPTSCLQFSSNCDDGFVERIAADGTLGYATLLGGAGFDQPTGIAADRSGNAYVVGSTFSADFPTVRPLQAACRTQYSSADCGDAFLAQLDASGSRLEFSTFLGGADVDMATAVALDSSGRVYVSGWTTSADFLLGGGVQPRNAGGPVFASDDEGLTWRLASDGITASEIRKLIVTPGRPTLLYAVGPRGVFRSEDAGRTWITSRQSFTSQVPNPAAVPSVTDLAVDPQSPNIAYAAVLYGGVYKTLDSGITWMLVNNGLTNQFVTGLDPHAIAIAPSTPSTLYLNTGSFLFRTTDGASTWTRVRQTAGTGPLVVDPTDARMVYMSEFTGFMGVSRSADGGATWSAPVRLTSRTEIIEQLLISPFNASTLYASGVLGVYRSADAGATWTAATGLPDIGPFRISLSAVNGTLYAAAVDMVFRSRDDGRSWAPLSSSLRKSVQALASAVDRATTLYAAGVTEGDAFVAQIDPAAGTLVAGTLVGGRRDERANALAIAPDGTVYVAGETRSADFPVRATLTGVLRGDSDAFLVVLVPTMGKPAAR